MVRNEPMASVVLRLFVQLYLLLLPARPIVIQSVSQSVKLLRLPLGSGGCNAADPFLFFVFVLRVWARTSVSASSSTIPCCWSWPSRTWCSTTPCEAADQGSFSSRPLGGGVVGYNLNTAAQNPVRIHTHSGLTGSWVYFLKVEPLWQ